MNSETLNDKIERYLLGQMQKEEIILFEKEINNIPEFHELIKLHKSLLYALNHERKAFRNKLEVINMIEKEHQNNNKISTFRFPIVTSTMFIIIAAAIFIYKSRITNDSKFKGDEINDTLKVKP